jgi:aspartyl/asparaginyl beta-hydroxylase (cupin superfamily)
MKVRQDLTNSQKMRYMMMQMSGLFLSRMLIGVPTLKKSRNISKSVEKLRGSLFQLIKCLVKLKGILS